MYLEKKIYYSSELKKNIFLKIVKRWDKKKIKNYILFNKIILEKYILARNWRFLKKRRRKTLVLKKVDVFYRLPFRKVISLLIPIKSIYYWSLYLTKRQVHRYMMHKKLKKMNNVFNYYMKLKDKFHIFSNIKYKKKLFIKLKSKIFNLYFFYLKSNFNNFFKYIYLFKNLIEKKYLNFYFFNIYFFIFLNFINSNFFKYLKNYNRLYIKNMETKIAKKKIIYHINALINKRLKKSFYLKKRIGILKIRNTNSNFFVTLTDLNNNVLGNISTGQISNSRMKKRKMSPYLVNKMMSRIRKKIIKYKLNNLVIRINSKINKHMHNAINYLKHLYFCRIKLVTFSKPVPHHYGQRKQKSKRL